MPRQIKSATFQKLFVCRRGDEAIPVYPLTLGVVGHRRLAPEALEIVRAQTRDFLTRLAEYWRKEQGTRADETSRAPFVVFNGLAAGADALVAEEVLRLKATRPELDLRLVAALPAPRAIYEQDFAPGEELDQFRRLAASADDLVEIALTEENRRWLEANPDAPLPAELRKAQYEALGRSLAESSLYVLALWDGVEARLAKGEVVDDDRGGTADVVRMKTTATAFAFETPFQLESTPNDARGVQALGAVFHLVAPRDGASSDPELKPGRFFVYLPQNPGDAPTSLRTRRRPLVVRGAFFKLRSATSRGRARRFGKAGQTLRDVVKPLKETALFNRDAVEGRARTLELRRDAVAYLLGDDYAKLDADARALVERYAVADASSIWFQRRFFRAATFYFGLFATFTVSSCALTLGGGSVSFVWIATYYAALLAMIYMFWRQKKLAYYERHHRYRALAEALRVQIFWRVAGITDDVRVGYWTHQIKELNWLRFTVKSASASVASEPGAPDYGVALERWVRDQRMFLERRVASFHRKERALGTWGQGFAAVGLLGLFVRVLPRLVERWPAELQSGATILLATASFLAFACFTWNRLKAHGSQRKRYVKLIPIYRRVEETLTTLATRAGEEGADAAALDRDRQKLLRYLGAVALSENADWFLAKRRLELPK